jgi:hypothetical protein
MRQSDHAMLFFSGSKMVASKPPQDQTLNTATHALNIPKVAH